MELTLADTRFANADAQGELTSATWRSGEGSGFGRGARLPGRLELVGSLSRGRAAAVARYLPLGVPEAARRYVEGAVVDGWGKPFVVLDGAEQGDGGIAQIVSGGPDMSVGGDDDVSYVVQADGGLKDRQIRRGGAGGARRRRG